MKEIVTAAAGKKWLGEDTQQYRPTKRKDGHEADNWQCRDAHDFVDGFCSRCKEPEIDELEAVECDYCRAIFEHTGRKHCPVHQDAQDLAPLLNEPQTSLPKQLEAPENRTLNIILRAKEIQEAHGITFSEALTEAQLIGN